VRLRNVPKLTCSSVTGMTAEECLDCAKAAAGQFRRGWLRAIGAPDYRAYLEHHAGRHPGVAPLSERDYVALFIERRFASGGGRCC
jgi:uncharacterized short protein YbdD (DUF466 family)